MHALNVALALSLLALSPAAHAYVGPGLGLGAIGVIAGVLVSVLLALFALTWYPVKRLLAKGKSKRKPPDPGPGSEPDGAPDMEPKQGS